MVHPRRALGVVLVSPLSVALGLTLALPELAPAPPPPAKSDRAPLACPSCEGSSMRLERVDDPDAGVTVLTRVPIRYRVIDGAPAF